MCIVHIYMHVCVYIYIYIYIYTQGTHLFSAHLFGVPSAHLFSVLFPHIIPHIIFDGGLHIELGKAEDETGVNRGETKVTTTIKENPVCKEIHGKGNPL